MQARILWAEEFEQAKDLWDYCFEKRTDPFFAWYFDDYCRPDNLLGVFSGSQFAGMLHLNPYTINLNNRAIDTSYIVGVATAPQFRRQGVLRVALSAGFAEMEKRGQAIAVLMPAAAGLYMPYGFAFCYNQLRYDIPLDKLSGLFKKTEFTCNFLKEGDIAPLSQVYDACMSDMNGFVRRGKKEWQNILAEHKTEGGYAVYIGSSTKYFGYMLYLTGGGIFRIVELMAADDSARETMLAYAAQHLSQCSKFLWQSPINDLTYLKFPTSEYYPAIKPFMMGRIIDAAKALGQLKLSFEEKKPVIIRLIDTFIENNNSVFCLTAQNGQAILEKTDQAPQVVMDIGTFAQLCFSAYTVKELVGAGRIVINDLAALPVLERAFPHKINYINEYF